MRVFVRALLVTVSLGAPCAAQDATPDAARSTALDGPESVDGVGSVSSTHEVLSLVGPLLSTHERVVDDIELGSYFVSDEWSTIDLRNGAEVTLAEQLDGAVVELVPDRLLVEEISRLPASLTSVPELEQHLAAFEIVFGGSAIVRWDPERGVATWRVFAKARRLHHHVVVSLDLVAAPQPWLRPYLDAAREGRGLLLERGALSSDGR